MPPRPKKPSERATTTNALTSAVSFLSSILKDEGSPFETHVLLANKTITAFNGTIAAGALIDTDISCAPHNKTLLAALQKCGDGFSLTQVDQAKLSIKSGKFRAIVPCVDPNILPNPTPDLSIAPIDDKFKDALKLISIKSNGEQIYDLSFLINGGSVIATDGRIIIECWHGLDLPPGLPIPKALIPAITGHPAKLCGFGFSPNSVTFWFNDNSWIRSQLYAQTWPNVARIMERESNPLAVPSDFFTGLETIAPFSEGYVIFNKGLLRTHKDDGKGAMFEVEGLVSGPIYSLKYLNMIKGIADKIDFYVAGEHKSYMCFFKGSNVRGVIAGHG